MAPRTPKTIAKSARTPPVPTKEDEQEAAREKADATRSAKLSNVELEAARAGSIGRILGWGQEARNWQIGIVAIAGILIMTAVYFFARQERHADLALTFLIQAFTGTLAYFIGKSRNR